MSWILKFFTSSIGQKVIMSLTGLFLISFLFVHLIGNLQLLAGDNGEAFNIYSDFMSNNPLIQGISKGLYLFIVLHAIQGFMMAWKNKKAKTSKYAGGKASGSWASKNMALLGTLVLAFMLIHMGDFWYKIKFDSSSIAAVKYAGMDHEIKNVYAKVLETFKNPLFVVAYLVGLLALAFHLGHGFQSAFQTLGLRHKKYTPAINFLGLAFAILIPLGFAILPLFMYFN